MLQVRLLGPVDLTVKGTVRAVSGLRRKAVLAVLGLHGGETVSTDRLIDMVWEDSPPATAANTLHHHVSYLRGILGTRTAIVARPPGFRLDLPGDATDLAAAERLIRLGRAATDPAEGAALLRSALSLWRGQPLADLSGLSWVSEQAERLNRIRLAAVETLVEIRLTLGEHVPLLPELEELTEQHPFHEELHGQLMLALYRAGRQADALAAFQRLRRTLGEDLGIRPGAALRDLEAAILRQDISLELPPARVATSASPAARMAPAQLPLDISGFTGRGAELARMDEILAAGSDPPTVTNLVVSGQAGVGKTALAVNWAHRVASRFPDGQLYVNLHGFDEESAMDPAEAVRGFLVALGVAAEAIPALPDSRASLLRTTLAGRRVLMVVDNARDSDQVRPLLPGSPGCVVVVTSRNQLTGLVANTGARSLNLGLLSAGEARDLLASRLGATRVAAEPSSVDDIVARCARLPLALTLAAARAAVPVEQPLSRLADQLRDDADALDELHNGDPATDIRAVFSWSYRTLSAEAATLFRQLGQWPGPDIGLPALVSLAGRTSREVRPILAELTRVHLLTEHTPGRYTFHGLLRAYANDLAGTHDSDDQRRAAVRRLFDHYLHTAQHAALLLHPMREPIAVSAPRPGVTPERLADTSAAVSWFTTEYQVLLAVIRDGTRLGFEVHAWQLAWAMSAFLNHKGHGHDHHAALHAVTRLADQTALAYVRRGLASTRPLRNIRVPCE